MTFRSLNLRNIKTLTKDAQVLSKHLSFDNVIVSGRILLKSLYRLIMEEQTSIMGLHGHKDYHYIYFNNYIIVIDFIFRLLINFNRFYERLVNNYKARTIILINDVDEDSLPQQWRIYIPKNDAYVTVEEVEIMSINKIKSLRRLLEINEMEEFDRWESYLSSKYPHHYDFCLRDNHTHIKNEKLKYKETMEFLHFIMLSQMRLTKKRLIDA